MKIYLAADHAGYEMKEGVKEYLAGLGHEVEDLGARSLVQGDDYPDYVVHLADMVSDDAESFGFVFGGSGQGEAMCANRVRGVRAAVFYGQELPETPIDAQGRTMGSDSFAIVKLAREHNNANVLSFGARFVTVDEAKFACELFLSTKFSGDEHHRRRLGKF